MSLPPEILKKVKRLELNTRKMVNNIFAGSYKTTFKGQGMTFAEFREYVPGDDVRHISWPLTARTGKPYIKKFDEERELTMMLAVDISGSSDYGSGEYFKGEVINHLAAIMGYSANKNNDQVGLLLFSDQVEHFVPPKKGRGHVHRILRDLYYYKPKSRGTKISEPLEYLQGVLKKRASIFMFSDFMDENYAPSLRLLGRRHDIVAVVVEDPTEQQIPEMGVVDLHDAETGETITVDTSSFAFQKNYKEILQRETEARDTELRRSQVDRIDIVSNEDFIDPLIAYFRRKAGR